MTDNEIIKALECCANEGFQDCEDCPLNIPHQPCSKVKLPRISLDLINRQKVEIERLKKNQVVHIDIGEQFKKECEYEIKTARTEAIKEFAERLKVDLDDGYDIDIVDAIVKEMVGEQE